MQCNATPGQLWYIECWKCQTGHFLLRSTHHPHKMSHPKGIQNVIYFAQMPLEIELTLPERHPKFGIFSHNDLEKLLWCWCNQCCTYKKSEKFLEWTLSMTGKCLWRVILIKRQCWELTVHTFELQSKFLDAHEKKDTKFLDWYVVGHIQIFIPSWHDHDCIAKKSTDWWCRSFRQ